jgi:transposase
MHMAARNPDRADTPVGAFRTFTEDLHGLASWFKACGVTSVAMESSGVNWIPVFEILWRRRFEVIPVNARFAKNVPGRKADVSNDNDEVLWATRIRPGVIRTPDLPTLAG